MLSVDKMLRLFIELIFIMLGGMIVWLALSGRFAHRFDPTGVKSLVLSAALIAWGVRVLLQRKQFWMKWENWTRGLSLVLVGVLMLAMSRAPFAWVGPLLAAAGG